MTREAEELLARARTLSDDDRRYIANELLDTVEPDAEWEAAWSAEIKRRLADPAQRAGASDWSEVKARYLARTRK